MLLNKVKFEGEPPNKSKPGKSGESEKPGESGESSKGIVVEERNEYVESAVIMGSEEMEGGVDVIMEETAKGESRTYEEEAQPINPTAKLEADLEKLKIQKEKEIIELEEQLGLVSS